MAVGDAVKTRELRIALVLNGGVSLAVWISGVVHELDRLRRAFSSDQQPNEDAALYRSALEKCGYSSVRIDVISGASAGGINGALLAGAIQGGPPQQPTALRASNAQGVMSPLRDLWVELGDLSKLVRRGAAPFDAIPSLFDDADVLKTLSTVLAGLLAPSAEAGTDQARPLHLFMTATDLQGHGEARFATATETIIEPDHRITFRFSSDGGAYLTAPQAALDPGQVMELSSENAAWLAAAARSSSSFPVAFSPYKALVAAEDGGLSKYYMVDGGLLDNQPFDPMVDRITQMEVHGRWRRVVCYVVPYVSEHSVLDAEQGVPQEPTLVDVARSGGLARDLPKLQSLQRIEFAQRDASLVEAAFASLFQEPDAAAAAASAALPVYRRVQASELLTTVEEWVANPRAAGDGPRGGSGVPSGERAANPPLSALSEVPADLEPLLPAAAGTEAVWAMWEDPDERWSWGLSKAERFGRTALSWARFLDESGGADLELARLEGVWSAATALTHMSREAMEERRRIFNSLQRDAGAGAGGLARQHFVASYAAISDRRTAVAGAMSATCAALGTLTGLDPSEAFRQLAAVEVVRHTAGVRGVDPPKFDLYRFSARTPPAFPTTSSPEPAPQAPASKLAGMKLMHFAAFLKRSWRVNDWMQGRLDGAYWICRMLEEQPGQLSDLTHVLRLEVLREELPKLAEAAACDEAT